MTRAAIRQADFASALLDPECTPPAGLRNGAGFDPRRCFAVHRNNMMVALVDALASAFPVTRTLVGEDYFRAMAREHVRSDPPRSPMLADYGDGFADFIAGYGHGVPYLADMARLERLRQRAYHAADAVPVANAAYQSLATEPARLAASRVKLHPACDWLRSGFAVRSIWNAHQGHEQRRDAELDAVDVDVPEAALVTRPQWEVLVAALPEGGGAWLDALRDGRTLVESLPPTASVDGTAPLESLLSVLLQHGLVIELISPTEY